MAAGLNLALNARRRGSGPARAPVPFAALGLRRLIATYAGPVVRLRRSSDNAEQDFGVAADGWLDGAAVLAWCAGASAFATALYGQAGGVGVSQATAAGQPRLVNAGVLDTVADRPALRFLGAQWLQGSLTPKVHATLGAITVQQLNATGGSNRYLWSLATGTTPGAYLQRNLTNGTSVQVGDVVFIIDNTVGGFTSNPRVVALGPYASVETAPVLWESFGAATGRALRVNGVAVTERSGLDGVPYGGADTLVLGRATNGSAYYQGHICELSLFSDVSDAGLAAVASAVRPFWGI